MDRATALSRLRPMVAADQRPALSDSDLGGLLDGARARDSLGRYHGDAGWAETYDLNRAAMEGWRLKAAKVAGDFSFQADNASYSKGEVLASMERMVAMYAQKVQGSTGSPVERDYDWTGLLP